MDPYTNCNEPYPYANYYPISSTLQPQNSHPANQYYDSYDSPVPANHTPFDPGPEDINVEAAVDTQIQAEFDTGLMDEYGNRLGPLHEVFCRLLDSDHEHGNVGDHHPSPQPFIPELCSSPTLAPLCTIPIHPHPTLASYIPK